MNNSLENYRAGLAQVAAKTQWRVGLIVNVAGEPPLLVYKILPLEHKQTPETLTAEYSQHASATHETNYIYQYTGNNILANGKYSTFAIFLKTLTETRIGGAPENDTRSFHHHGPPKAVIQLLKEHSNPNFTKGDAIHAKSKCLCKTNKYTIKKSSH